MSVRLSHDDWGVEDAACDSKGNVFATLWKSEVDGPADRPLLMFDHTGLLKARFSSSSKDDPRLSIHEPTALVSDGGVARLASPRWSRDAPWLIVFSADGKLKSKVQLDPPGFLPYQLAVFPSGKFLVSGLEHVHSRRALGAYKNFTAFTTRTVTCGNDYRSPRMLKLTQRQSVATPGMLAVPCSGTGRSRLGRPDLGTMETST
jgi:hypothetical protein